MKKKWQRNARHIRPTNKNKYRPSKNVTRLLTKEKGTNYCQDWRLEFFDSYNVRETELGDNKLIRNFPF